MTSQTLRSLAKAGRIYPDTLIRKEGSTKTMPAGKIKGLLTDSDQAHNTIRQKALDEEDTMKDVVACRHCNKEVARTASVCPHCGGDNPGITREIAKTARKIQEQITAIIGIGIIVILILSLMMARSMCKTGDELQRLGRELMESGEKMQKEANKLK